MSADDDNKRCALNSLREDVETKYKEAQNYEKWTVNLRQIYLLGLFSRILAEINDETLSKMRGDYEYKELVHKIKRAPFLIPNNPVYEYYRERIIQIAQKIERNLTS